MSFIQLSLTLILIGVTAGIVSTDGGLVGPIIVRMLPERLTKIGIGIAALGLAVSLFIQAY